MKIEIDARGLRIEINWRSVRATARAILRLVATIGALLAGAEITHLMKLLGG